MSEETIKDPRDLNGDGKVTLEEKIKYAAGKAGEKLNEVADEVKAKEIYGEMKENAAALADKAKDKFDLAKDKIENLKEKKEGKETPEEPKA